MSPTGEHDRHEPLLVKLAKRIDWARFDAAWGRFYHEKKGRPGLPTRLMADLHLLKHIHVPSDEEVCARWVENPYWRAPRAHVSGMLRRKEEMNGGLTRPIYRQSDAAIRGHVFV